MADTAVAGPLDFLIRIGFLNLIVPFILFYAIVFGMLEKTQLFSRDPSKSKDEMRNLHALIAFALAITATATSYAVGITQNFLPILGIASVVLLGFMMVLGMAFGPEFDKKINEKCYKGITIGIAIILLLVAGAVIAYNGLIVGTPCPMDNSLRGVNTLNPGPGECTNAMDFSELAQGRAYVMGIDVFGILNTIPAGIIETIVFVVVMAVLVGLVIKKSG